MPFYNLKNIYKITDQLNCNKLLWKSSPHSSSNISKTYSFEKNMRRKTAIFDKTSKKVTEATMKKYLVINPCWIF